MHDLIRYRAEEGPPVLQLRDGSACPTQRQSAESFASSKQNIGLPIRNILDEGDLSSATVKQSSTVRDEGGRQVKRPVLRYTPLTVRYP